MRRRRRLSIFVGIAVLGLICLAGWFRAYAVHGVSDAPNFLLGDRVIVNRLAYDLVVPFTNKSLLRLTHPERGDMILCRLPQTPQGTLYLKRVVGLPGDRLEMVEHRLVINGEPLSYEFLDRASFAWVPAENRLGSVIARETGGGSDRLVTFTPEAKPDLASFGPLEVPAGRYFVLGDSRDVSLDSRQLGLVTREHVYGRCLTRYWRSAR